MTVIGNQYYPLILKFYFQQKIQFVVVKLLLQKLNFFYFINIGTDIEYAKIAQNWKSTKRKQK